MKRYGAVWIVQLRSKVKWEAKGASDSPLVARTLCRMFNICSFFSLTPAVKYSLSSNSRKTRNSANNSSIAEKNTYIEMFIKHNRSFRRPQKSSACALLLVHIFLPNFFLPVNFAFNMLWYSTPWTVTPFSTDPLWLSLFVEGVNDRLLDHCQVSSVPYYCCFKEQEIPRIYTVWMVIYWNSNVFEILIFDFH